MTFSQMARRGTPFEKHICSAFMVAEYKDRAKLGKAFPLIYAKYLEMVEKSIGISR